MSIEDQLTQVRAITNHWIVTGESLFPASVTEAKKLPKDRAHDETSEYYRFLEYNKVRVEHIDMRMRMRELGYPIDPNFYRKQIPVHKLATSRNHKIE